MIGHFKDNMEQMRSVLWPDAELESIVIDYDSVKITVTESTGIRKEVKCEGYIGYKAIGFWDEMIIENAKIDGECKLIDCCLRDIRVRYKNNTPESGSPRRNQKQWSVLTVVFIDGHELKIAASTISVKTL